MQCCSRAWERRIRRHAETGWGGRGAAGWPVARRRAGSEGADGLRRGQHGDSEQEGKGRLTLGALFGRRLRRRAVQSRISHHEVEQESSGVWRRLETCGCGGGTTVPSAESAARGTFPQNLHINNLRARAGFL